MPSFCTLFAWVRRSSTKIHKHHDLPSREDDLVTEATGGIEQCQFDTRTNQFYISVPEVNHGDGFVYVFDVNGNLVNKFDIPVASCSHPQGLAIGPAPQILLGCNGTANANNPTAIINESTGLSSRRSINSRELMKSGSIRGTVSTSWRGQRQSVPLSC